MGIRKSAANRAAPAAIMIELAMLMSEMDRNMPAPWRPAPSSQCVAGRRVPVTQEISQPIGKIAVLFLGKCSATVEMASTHTYADAIPEPATRIPSESCTKYVLCRHRGGSRGSARQVLSGEPMPAGHWQH